MIFILNRQEKIVGVLKNNGDAFNGSPFFDDVLTQDLATGSETFSFTTISNDLTEDIVVGNFIAFSKNGKYKLFQIMQTEESHEDVIYKTAYCESAGLELLNKVFRTREINSCTLRKFLETVTDDTGWSVGTIDATFVNTIDLNIEDCSVYSALQNTIPLYGGEMEFSVEINGGRISRKIINVYKYRGNVTGKRFQFGKDIENIIKRVDTTELATALIGRGKNGLSFKDITIDGIDKPSGQDYVSDQNSFNRYNHNGYHIVKIFNYETESPQELLRETYKALEKVKDPRVEYEVSVALMGELLGESWNNVSIGDTVAIVDNSFNPPLHLMARVSKLETSFTNPQGDMCTFSNFIEVKSNITDEMRKLANQLEGYVDKNFDEKFPVVEEDIKDGAVTGDKIHQTSITVDHLSAGLIEAVEGKFEELEVGYLEADKIVTDKIEATEGKFDEITADLIEADKIITDSIIATEGKFDEITADLIEADKVITDKIEAVEGDFGKITADLIVADEILANKITATEGNFEILNAQVGKIDTLVNGNLTSDNIQSGTITGGSLNMDTIFVKDANIIDLSANKLTAGQIDTSQIFLHSSDGGMKLVGATQQFLDKNDRVRIQLGQDNNGDFDFYILAENGDILFNTRGITGNAIESGLIKEDMVGDGAIGGKKINWSSFATEFNKETNTTTLNSSKIMLDGTNQTLDVHFNKLSSTVDDVKETTNSNTTQLDVQLGKINTLIQDTTIEKEGQTLKLKDEYSKLEQTVDGVKTTVGTHTSELSSLGKKVEVAETQIKQNVNSIELKASKTEVTEAINGVIIGGRNLALKTSKEFSTPYTDFKGETNSCSNLGTVLVDGFKIGDTVTVRVLYKFTNIVNTSGQNAQCWIQGSGNNTAWGSGSFGGSKRYNISGSGEFVMEHSFVITAEHLKNTSWSTNIRHDYVQSGSVQHKLYKVENGTKATDWTPAPEDTTEEIKTTVNQAKAEIKIETDKISQSVSNLNSVVDKKADGSTVSNLSNKVATIETNVNSITQRVSSTESTVSTHTTQIGAVDGKINTAKNEAINTASTDATNKSNKALADGKTYTNGEITKTTTTMNNKFAEIKTTTDGISQTVSSVDSKVTTVTTTANTALTNANKGIADAKTAQTTANTANTTATTANNTANSNKSTIATHTTQIATVTNKTATLETNVNSITGRVSSVETSVTTVDGKVVAQEKRLTEAEQKITPTAIINSVSSSINDGSGKIDTVTTTLDKNGFTVKNGALTIKNKSNKDVLKGDVDGNLMFTGSITNFSPSGSYGINISRGDVAFHSTNELTSRLISTSLMDNRATNGLSIGLTELGNYIDISKEIGTDGEGYKYSSAMRYCTSINQYMGNTEVGFNFWDYVRFNKSIRTMSSINLVSSTNQQNRINPMIIGGVNDYLGAYGINGISLGYWDGNSSYTSPFRINKTADSTGCNINISSHTNFNGWSLKDIGQLWINSGNTSYPHRVVTVSQGNTTGILGVFGDNGAILGYQSGSEVRSRIATVEGNFDNSTDQIRSWGNWNCNGGRMYNVSLNRVLISNDVVDTTNKTFASTSPISTEGNKIRFIYKDIQIKNGSATLSIPKRFLGKMISYAIASVVKKGRGDVWVSDEREYSFLIEGENDIKVNIEVEIELVTSVNLSVSEAPVVQNISATKGMEVDCEIVPNDVDVVSPTTITN